MNLDSPEAPSDVSPKALVETTQYCDAQTALSTDTANSHREESLMQRVREGYFAQKNFESEALYRRLGVTVFKKYLPNGGDIAVRRGAYSGMPSTGTRIERMQALEQLSRRSEGIHVGGFAVYSALMIVAEKMLVTPPVLSAAYGGLNILVNVYPIMLQRYNRVRINRITQKHQNRNVADK